MSQTNKPNLISKDSVLPLGAVAALILASWHWSDIVARADEKDQARFERIEDQLIHLNRQLDQSMAERLSRVEMQTWVDIMRAHNPSILWQDLR